MSYETEHANIAHPTNVISDGVTAALVQGVVVAPLLRSEPLPQNTKIKLFRCDGYLVGEEVSESSSITADGDNEITQTTVTGTAVKLAAQCKVTVEVERFNPNLTEGEIARYLGQAIAMDWDDEPLGLFSSISNSVTCDAGAVPEKYLDAVYTVRTYTAGVSPASGLIAVCDYKAVNELQKYLIQSGASVWSQERMSTLLAGAPGTRGFRGSLPGMDIYETNGIPTGSGDDYNCVFDPEICFGTMVDETVDVRKQWLGATGGFATEYSGHIFCDVVIWNNYGGCLVKSDT